MTRPPAIMKCVCVPASPSQARQDKCHRPNPVAIRPECHFVFFTCRILPSIPSHSFVTKPFPPPRFNNLPLNPAATILHVQGLRSARNGASRHDRRATLRYATSRAAGYVCAAIAIANILAPLSDPRKPTIHPTFDPLSSNAATATYRPGAVACLTAPPSTSTLDHTHNLLGSQCWSLARNGCRHSLRLSGRIPSYPLAYLLYIQFSRQKSWDNRGRGGGFTPPFAFTAEELATPELATSPAV